MSRYWVFTEEQLEEALRKYEQLHGDPEVVMDFLNSQICIDLGMARDIAAPAAPEIHVAGETAP